MILLRMWSLKINYSCDVAIIIFEVTYMSCFTYGSSFDEFDFVCICRWTVLAQELCLTELLNQKMLNLKLVGKSWICLCRRIYWPSTSVSIQAFSCRVLSVKMVHHIMQILLGNRTYCGWWSQACRAPQFQWVLSFLFLNCFKLPSFLFFSPLT